MIRPALLLLLLPVAPLAGAAERFPLADVRLTSGPFLDAQNTNYNYLMALEPDRLLAPFRREAGLLRRARQATATGSPADSMATWAGTICPRWR
ncbi:glycoside hydrolase family 127 protein [Massilia sp. H-1]|nr:glycoside hydrolase family 127 protein [Massilia sp. H-1]